MFNDLRLDWSTQDDRAEAEEKVESGVRRKVALPSHPAPPRAEEFAAPPRADETVPSSETQVAGNGWTVTFPCGTPDLSYPYELRHRIGNGAMGEIWRARDLKLMRDVAIKVARGVFSNKDPFYEARLAARAEHPNLVRVYDAGLTRQGSPFLVMELLEGEDLASSLGPTGRFGAQEAIEVMVQLLSALEAVHAQGIVHRDIKPSNVFLADVPGQRQKMVKLLDFGVACGEKASASRRLVGTPMYMAPEQLIEGTGASQVTDVYGAAAVAFQMITGKQLCDSEMTRASAFEIVDSRNLAPLAELTDSALRRVLLSALHRDPRRRTPNARTFREQLLAWQTHAAAAA